MPDLQIFAHPDGKSWSDILASVKTANGLQTHFRCSLKELRAPVLGADGNLRSYEREVSRIAPAVEGLVFCERNFDTKNLVEEILPRRIYVSCRVHKGLGAPPFRFYLLYQIAAAALTLSAQLNRQTNNAMIHDPPVGCLWDWWKGRDERATAMRMARICPKCQDALKLHGGLVPESIVAAQQILEYVRRSMMGESQAVANRVFIAYGKSGDWLVLKTLLERRGLEVDYFNREAPAGVLVTERWREMLDRSRFAFAVMTPDDELRDGRKQARLNVVHEIGLCHARLGLRNTAILLADGTESFSNIDGVTYIRFQPGKLMDSAQIIEQLLAERGILEPRGNG